jgi:hypothetical protein
MDTLTIRRATEADSAALHRLAALDSASPPTGSDMLVAEVDGELWAALDLEDGRAIADPFRPSGELVGLLRFRAARVAAPAALRTAAWRRRLLARVAA